MKRGPKHLWLNPFLNRSFIVHILVILKITEVCVLFRLEWPYTVTVTGLTNTLQLHNVLLERTVETQTWRQHEAFTQLWGSIWDNSNSTFIFLLFFHPLISAAFQDCISFPRIFFFFNNQLHFRHSVILINALTLIVELTRVVSGSCSKITFQIPKATLQ